MRVTARQSRDAPAPDEDFPTPLWHRFLEWPSRTDYVTGRGRAEKEWAEGVDVDYRTPHEHFRLMLLREAKLVSETVVVSGIYGHASDVCRCYCNSYV